MYVEPSQNPRNPLGGIGDLLEGDQRYLVMLAVHNMTLEKKTNISIVRTTSVITPTLTDAPVAIVEIEQCGI